jgi:hypothetical protein
MKIYKHLTFMGCLLLFSIVQMAAQGFSFDSGSNESFGPINITENTTLPVPEDGIFHATTVDVAAGVSLNFTPNSFNTPVYILATGAVNVAGFINLNGGTGTNIIGGAGGPGGFQGGDPGSFGVDPGDGQGPGGGLGGTLTQVTDGAGSGSYASKGFESNSTIKGLTYGSPLLIPLIGGSGGGGAEGSPGVGGSGGGGAILVASDIEISILSTGTINANGGNTPHGSARQAGSGGAVRLVAPKVSGSGKINCASRWVNGLFYGNTQPERYAGAGRIRIDTIDRTMLSFTFYPIGFTSVGANMVVFPTPQPRLDITEVAGQAVTLDTTNAVFVDLPFNADPNRTVTVRAEDFNKAVKIAIVLQPSSGSRIIYEDTIDNSTNNPATKAINVVFPTNTQTQVFVWTLPDA